MYLLESVLQIAYFQKSALKIFMFLVLPIAYTMYDKNIRLRDNFKIKSRRSFFFSLALGIGVYGVILLTYFLLKESIDFSNIIRILDENVGVTKDNFVYVALYIAIVNSLLEEFFFRGFIFLNLKRLGNRKFAYLLSAFVFTIYHVAIMGSWFSPLLFTLALAGLFIGACLFNYLNEKSGNIYNSWIVHMMANLAINTVGLLMFGII